MKIRPHVLILLLLLLTSSWNHAVAARPDGSQRVHELVVRPATGQARQVRLQVLGPQLIRVSATATDSFPDPRSLMIVPAMLQSAAQGELTESPDTWCLSTTALRVVVQKQTGEIRFEDLQGRLLLQEQNGGGKYLAPYECQQTRWEPVAGADSADATADPLRPVPTTYRGWTTRVVFESPRDEAFYGLGQHQADEWNLKGRNEELYQYNTKVSIPFIVSSRNYGILYDSNSLMRFGNPADYAQLHRVFRLYDRSGKPGGLTGTYEAPDQVTLTRVEDSLYFENLRSARHLPKFPLAKAHVRYEGYIEPLETGDYYFNHYYSGYQRLFIDERSVYAERDITTGHSVTSTIWRTAWNPNARKFKLHLEAGRRYAVRLEWQPDGSEAYCGLRVLPPRPAAEQQKLSLWSEMSQQLDYYFVAGHNLDDVIHGYRQLTGKAQIMPRWLFGYWQSRERYKSQTEIQDALAGFRRRHLPIDNIVMDWNYWEPDAWGSFRFDARHFPHPQAMVDSIHGQHGRLMISCWPKYYLTVDNFRELNRQGMIYQQSVRDSLHDWLGYPYAFYDAYHPQARSIFWRQLYENLGTLGIDAWWMDASEPNVRDCTDLPYRKLLCGPTYLGSSDEYFNAYSLVNAQAIYDGCRAYATHGVGSADTTAFSPDNSRVFLLTRNGFAGLQRYSTATWSGDIGTRWEDMKAQITAGQNFSLSGVPYWSQDIGGFSVENRYAQAQRQFDKTGEETDDLREWRELNVRWHQWGVFTPMYRSHGQFPYREPWNIAPEGHAAYNVLRQTLQLRYQLLPYLYSLAARIHFDDYTMLRPMVMDYGDDPRTQSLGYQFLCGPSLMVCPVTQYRARNCDVYFPRLTGRGCWYDFRTGAIASRGGEQRQVDAPYDHIPVYVPSGSILPAGPTREWTGQAVGDTLRIFVYQGLDGDFVLYDDEGDNYGYEAGRYSQIPFHYDDFHRQLTIGARRGSYPGMPRRRTFVIVSVSLRHARGFDPQAHGHVVHYDGQPCTIVLHD